MLNPHSLDFLGVWGWDTKIVTCQTWQWAVGSEPQLWSPPYSGSHTWARANLTEWKITGSKLLIWGSSSRTCQVPFHWGSESNWSAEAEWQEGGCEQALNPTSFPKRKSRKGSSQPTSPELLSILNPRFQITSGIQRMFHVKGKSVNSDWRKQVTWPQRRGSIWKDVTRHHQERKRQLFCESRLLFENFPCLCWDLLPFGELIHFDCVGQMIYLIKLLNWFL